MRSVPLTAAEVRYMLRYCLEPTMYVTFAMMVCVTVAVSSGALGASSMGTTEWVAIIAAAVGALGTKLVEFFIKRVSNRHEAEMTAMNTLVEEMKNLRGDVKANADEISSLRQQNRDQQAELDRQRNNNHDLRDELQAARLLSDILGRELDELSEASGKPKKYAEIRESIKAVKNQ